MSEKQAFPPPELIQDNLHQAGDTVASLGSPDIASVTADYRAIALLRDARSYARDGAGPYPEMSGEELRTAKSIAVLRKAYAGDEEGLLGAKA